jgi:ketosteroid isomerase-like protein
MPGISECRLRLPQCFSNVVNFAKRMESPRMPDPKYAGYKASRPYFELVRGALGDLVDGEHFFDIVTDDVVYEVLYDFPGWPRLIQGRANLMEKFRGYGDNIELQSADKLITHKVDNGRILIIEYEVHGTILATGVKYNNRFCSIVRIESRINDRLELTH